MLWCYRQQPILRIKASQIFMYMQLILTCHRWQSLLQSTPKPTAYLIVVSGAGGLGFGGTVVKKYCLRALASDKKRRILLLFLLTGQHINALQR